MSETNTGVVFPKKPRKIETNDNDLREINEYMRYMVERLEFKIKYLERRVQELESV